MKYWRSKDPKETWRHNIWSNVRDYLVPELNIDESKLATDQRTLIRKQQLQKYYNLSATAAVLAVLAGSAIIGVAATVAVGAWLPALAIAGGALILNGLYNLSWIYNPQKHYKLEYHKQRSLIHAARKYQPFLIAAGLGLILSGVSLGTGAIALMGIGLTVSISVYLATAPLRTQIRADNTIHNNWGIAATALASVSTAMAVIGILALVAPQFAALAIAAKVFSIVPEAMAIGFAAAGSAVTALSLVAHRVIKPRSHRPVDTPIEKVEPTDWGNALEPTSQNNGGLKSGAVIRYDVISQPTYLTEKNEFGSNVIHSEDDDQQPEDTTGSSLFQ